jgi:predicted metal-dependent hydrolase
MEYVLTRSKRKTVAIYVRNGKVEVRAPLNLAKREIDKFVLSKKKWIKDALAKSSERTKQNKQKEAFTLNYGDTVLYRGKEYPITLKNGSSRAGFDGGCFYMPDNVTPAQIKDACVQIYRMLAKQYLTERTSLFAKSMNVTPNAIKISGAASRWGSCSGKKNINYSWRLVMAADEIIDYVVVHELAHLTEMNHSAKFWAVVAGVLPDYKERRAGLRELQHRLGGEDWK